MEYQEGTATLSFNLEDILDDCIVCGDPCNGVFEDRAERYKSVGNWCPACISKTNKKVFGKTPNGHKKIVGLSGRPLSQKQLAYHERMRGIAR